ncbi:hypothetical protein DFH09DRAFT_1292790, partial [Mycena vulgaris]
MCEAWGCICTYSIYPVQLGGLLIAVGCATTVDKKLHRSLAHLAGLGRNHHACLGFGFGLGTRTGDTGSEDQNGRSRNST